MTMTSLEKDVATLSPGAYMHLDRLDPGYQLQTRDYPDDRDTYHKVIRAITTLHADTMDESARLAHAEYLADEAQFADGIYDQALKTAKSARLPRQTDLGEGQGRTLQEYVDLKVAAVDRTGPHIWSGAIDLTTGKRIARDITFENLARFADYPRPRFTPLAAEPVRQPAKIAIPETRVKQASMLEAIIGSVMLYKQWPSFIKEWAESKLPTFGAAKNPIGSIALSR